MSFLAAYVTASALLAAPGLTTELVFPFNPQHNHGSSIVETAGGGLLAVWFHGSGERWADDVMLLGARRKPGADAWSETFVMADTPDLPDCNPVLFVDPRGTLWLFWIAVQDNEWGGSLLKFRTSTDFEGDGPPKWDWQDVIHCRPQGLEEEFTALLEHAEEQLGPLIAGTDWFQNELEAMRRAPGNKLTRRLGWMTRVHPVMTSDTRMMLGLYSDVFNCSLAAFTEDWGKTWSFSRPILSPQVSHLANIQPSFAVRRDGACVAYMRDNGLPKRVRTAVSRDGGLTWGDYGWLEIPNPGASVEVLVLESGAWVLVCNDALNGRDGRHRLSVYISDDEGASWPVHRPVEDMPPGEGSASYPSIIQTRDGSIHLTYSYKVSGEEGSTIKHACFTEAWIRGEAPASPE